MQQTVNTVLILKTKGKTMEIPKYRAWVTGTENIMYQPHEVWISHGEVWLSNAKGLPEKKVAADKVLLSRATGCKDQNGVEIFEGDVVRQVRTQPTIENETITGVVTMLEGAWLIVNDNEQLASDLWSETDENEILGNIYENPELLEL